MALDPAIVFALLAMGSFGIADFLAKRAVDKIGSDWALRISVFFGTTLVLVFSLAFVPMPALAFPAVAMAVFAGIVGGVGWVAFYRALSDGNVSIVSPIASSWGFVAFLLGLVVLSEPLSAEKIVAALAVFAGIVLASVSFKDLAALVRMRTYPGAKKAIVAFVAFGLSAFFTNLVVKELGAFYSIVFNRYASIILIFLFTKPATRLGSVKIRVLLPILAIGLLDAIGFLGYNQSQVVGLLSISSAIVSASPLITLALALALLREKINLSQLAGILLIVAGLVGLGI